MLPTPSTSHVDYDRIYEPAEDSYLLLDTLSSEAEKAYLHSRFNGAPSPLIVEIGTGSGVVLSFLHANAETILGREDVLTAGVDVNRYACAATRETIRLAETGKAQEAATTAEGGNTKAGHGFYLGNVLGDLGSCFRNGGIDVLVFNPPYVPTATLPALAGLGEKEGKGKTTFEEDSHFLELSYAGGADGMETTDRLLEDIPRLLSERGCAYILLCAQNKPEEVKSRLRAWGQAWEVETVGSSGKKAGWEKLVIVRVARVPLTVRKEVFK